MGFYTINNSKGITLITLVVTIIVLLILAGIATYSGIEAIENSKYTKFSAELKIMQTYVNQWYDDLKDKEGDFAENIDKKLGKVTGGAGASNTHDNTAQAALDAAGIDSSKYSHFYLLDDSVKEKLGVEGVTQEILVSIQDRTVVSYRGLNFKGNMYYTLEDIGEMYNVDYENPNTNSPTISVTGRSVYYGNTAKNAKYKFTVDISQSSDYISKGDVYYGKLKDGIVENWYHTDEDNFTVDREENGTYQIYYKDAAGNISNQVEYVIEPKATLINGTNFNKKMKTLAGNSSAKVSDDDTNITKFKIASTRPDSSILDENNIVSTATSLYPVYMWFDDGTIYIWSEENWFKISSMENMFRELKKIESISELNKLYTSNVTTMASMFNGCMNLTELNVSNFDTRNVTSMNNMFQDCSKLTSLNVGKFDTKNVIGMWAMFYNCSSLTELDVSNFDTRNVTDLGAMFFNCKSLTELDVSNFDTKKVTNMQSTFNSCRKLTELDVSNFDTRNVTSMYAMFYNCTDLTTIYASNKFITTSLTNDSLIFGSSSKIVGGAGTTYDSSHTDSTYAHIDGGQSNPGYFTKK